MTLQEQALQSGLVFRDCEDDPVPQWNAKDWPRLLGDWRSRHASVVVNHPDKENTQTVVVLGGTKINQAFTKSVLVLNLDPNEENREWLEGPPMNELRREHAAVVCNGGVYVVGGGNGKLRFDSIERGLKLKTCCKDRMRRG